VISLISQINRLRGPSQGADRLSFFIMWLSIVPSVGFAIMVWTHPIFRNGPGSFAGLMPLLGYLGCLAIALGVTTRLVAVATLRRQFTVTVSIVAHHQIVETGLYRSIRHPAYLGHLASMLGIGLISGNWLSLALMVALPLAGTLYRIHVEEAALVRHFGPAYEAYARRTRRLLPGIY